MPTAACIGTDHLLADGSFSLIWVCDKRSLEYIFYFVRLSPYSEYIPYIDLDLFEQFSLFRWILTFFFFFFAENSAGDKLRKEKSIPIGIGEHRFHGVSIFSIDYDVFDMEQVSYVCFFISVTNRKWMMMPRRTPWLAQRCHWSNCPAKRTTMNTIHLNIGIWRIQHREFSTKRPPTTKDFSQMPNSPFFFQWLWNADSLAERFIGFWHSGDAIRLHERWSMVWLNIDVHCRRYLHVLCACVGEMFAHSLSSHESAIIDIWWSG